MEGGVITDDFVRFLEDHGMEVSASTSNTYSLVAINMMMCADITNQMSVPVLRQVSWVCPWARGWVDYKASMDFCMTTCCHVGWYSPMAPL